jgi:hypothetical protein
MGCARFCNSLIRFSTAATSADDAWTISESNNPAVAALEGLEIWEIRRGLEAGHVSVRFRLRALPDGETRQRPDAVLQADAAVAGRVSQEHGRLLAIVADQFGVVALLRIAGGRSTIGLPRGDIFGGARIAGGGLPHWQNQFGSSVQEWRADVRVIEQLHFKWPGRQVANFIANRQPIRAGDCLITRREPERRPEHRGFIDFAPNDQQTIAGRVRPNFHAVCRQIGDFAVQGERSFVALARSVHDCVDARRAVRRQPAAAKQLVEPG